MKCKNCKARLYKHAKYCARCGAKVVDERVSLRGMYGEFTAQFLGWDNKYFKTFAALVIKPQAIIKEYLSGVRARYTHPFVFFAINAAITFLLSGIFADPAAKNIVSVTDDKGNTIELNESQADSLKMESVTGESAKLKRTNYLVNKGIDYFSNFEDDYFNFFAFTMLPVFTLMAFLVFGRPYNFGEHLVINTYLCGFLMIFLALVVVLEKLFSLELSTPLFFFSVAYYTYVYQRLEKYSVGKLIWKVMKFFLLTLVFIVLFFVLFFGIAYVFA